MGVSRGYQGWHQRRAWNAKAAAAATKKPVCKHRWLSTPPFLGDCAAHHCHSHDPGTTSPGEHMTHLRLLQHYAGLWNRRLAPHSVSLLPPPPPTASVSQSSLISCSFNHILSGWRTDALRRPTCQIQSWTPGAVLTKKRKGNFSQQPQEQRIKSPQSTWCTLHLWNTWIDNESSQNWGGGLWEQL